MTFKTISRCAAVLFLLLETACSHKPQPASILFTPSSSSTKHVTFVQWTDPHVFDAGKGRNAEGVREEELDNWAAFHWAVLETNRLALVEHRNIDFVVITGDFGLENVRLPDEQEGTVKSNTVCANRKAGDDGPIERVPLAEAAAETARELNASLIKRIYLVPGNNDLCLEDPEDLRRWAQFVLALQKDLQGLHDAKAESLNHGSEAESKAVDIPAKIEVEDLTDSVARLYDGTGRSGGKKDASIVAMFSNAPPPQHLAPQVINGIQMLGLNSAFFKRTQKSFAPDVSAELDWVGKQIQPGGSYLIFTHIPDLKDPYRLDKSWNIPPDVYNENWKKNVLERSEVLGIFAGHFHTPQRELYPQNFASLKPDETTTTKFWVAPPLAEKYQWQVPPEKTARGILLVSVSGDGDMRVSSDDAERVQSSALWFSTADQKAATAGDDKLAEARAAERDHEWDDAAKKYLEVLALSTADTSTRATALTGYLHAREKMRSWSWQSPLARWFYLHGIALLLTMGLTAAAIVLYLILRATALLDKVKGFLISVLVPRFSGRVTVLDTVQLTENAPSKEFGALLKAEGDKIRKRLQREQENWAAGQIALLAPSGNSLDALVTSIPQVEKVDVSALMKFLVNLFQVFRWSLQTGLAVIPPDQSPTPAAAGSGSDKDVVIPGAELNAYAVLQWGFITRKSWWCKRKVVNDRSAMRDLARELAELVAGEAFV
jgi:Calcineurin-like phosphoesterase